MALVILCLVNGIPRTLLGEERDKPQRAKKLSDLSLRDLLDIQVTTASKKAERSSDAPGVVTTITSDEIKRLGATSLLDILERAPSIQAVESSLFPHNLSVIRGDLRTQYDNHVLILINGRPIREGILGGINSPIYTAFPVEMIDRIEIVRGPGSVLYGTNAFVGVINIITKSDKEKSSLDLKVTAGSFGTYAGTATGALAKGDVTARFGAKIEDINGWNYSAMTVRPGSPNLPIDKQYGQGNLGLAADFAYRDLSVFGFYAHNAHDILGILPYATYAGKNKYDRLFLNLGYSHKLGDTWQAALNLSHSAESVNIDDEAAVPVDKHSSTDYLGELTVGGQVKKNLNIVVGGVVDSRNKNAVGPGDAIKNPYHQVHLSAYAQADYRPINDLKLIVGGQLNKPDSSGWNLVPRFGAIYRFTNDMGVKALYGQAFRSPWPIEQLLVNPAVVGNPNLLPERIATTDIQLFYASKKAEAAITFYNSLYASSITRQPLSNNPGVVTYVNQGKLHTNGLELEGKVAVTSSVMILGSATYQRNVDKNTVIVYVPDFMAKFGATVNVNADLTIGVFNTVFGRPRGNSGAKLNPEAKTVDLLSVNAQYRLPVRLPLELGVYAKNLLNSRYDYTEFNRGWVNTLPMGPGTAVYCSIGVKF
jgi:outer membrane receptor for ferrienterochelin and colicins